MALVNRSLRAGVDAAGGDRADDLRGITSYVSSYCISWVSGKVVMTMRRRLFGHMMGMPVSFLTNSQRGRCCHVSPTIPNRLLLLLPAH